MSTTWETIEERERRVRGTRTTSTMVRAGEQVPVGDTLKAAFAERPFINREDLRSIARHSASSAVSDIRRSRQQKPTSNPCLTRSGWGFPTTCAMCRTSSRDTNPREPEPW